MFWGRNIMLSVVCNLTMQLSHSMSMVWVQYGYSMIPVQYLVCRVCCGSGMSIPDTGSWLLFIPDPGSNNSNKRRGKNIFCPSLFCSHKIENLFYFWTGIEKNLSQFTKNYSTFYPKALKNKNLLRISYPGVWKAPESRIRIHNTGCNHRISDCCCINYILCLQLQ